MAHRDMVGEPDTYPCFTAFDLPRCNEGAAPAGWSWMTGGKCEDRHGALMPMLCQQSLAAWRNADAREMAARLQRMSDGELTAERLAYASAHHADGASSAHAIA